MRQSKVRDENVLNHARRHIGFVIEEIYPGDLKQKSLPYTSEIYKLPFIGVVYHIQINFIVFFRR